MCKIVWARDVDSPAGNPDILLNLMGGSRKRNLLIVRFCTDVGVDLVLSFISCLLDKFKVDLK